MIYIKYASFDTVATHNFEVLGKRTSTRINELSDMQKESAKRKDFETAKLIKQELGDLKRLDKAIGIVRFNNFTGIGKMRVYPPELFHEFSTIELVCWPNHPQYLLL